MKYITAARLAFVIGGILVVVACSSSERADKLDDNGFGNEQTGDDDDNDDGTLDTTSTGNTNKDASSNAPKPKMCVKTCAADVDCSDSCPATEGAIACCDLKTKTCFNSKAAVCPKTDKDSGTDTPEY
jgi:hypothetical protein